MEKKELRGGPRKGAGRPKGTTGPYKEVTKKMYSFRLSLEEVAVVKRFLKYLRGGNMTRAKIFNGEVCPYCGGTKFTKQVDEEKKETTLWCETCRENGHYTNFTRQDNSEVWVTVSDV